MTTLDHGLVAASLLKRAQDELLRIANQSEATHAIANEAARRTREALSLAEELVSDLRRRASRSKSGGEA